MRSHARALARTRTVLALCAAFGVVSAASCARGTQVVAGGSGGLGGSGTGAAATTGNATNGATATNATNATATGTGAPSATGTGTGTAATTGGMTVATSTTGGGPVCGNGVCEMPTESCMNCAVDCGACPTTTTTVATTGSGPTCHDPCMTGGPESTSCANPTWGLCATFVCGVTSSCCSSSWGIACILEAKAVCAPLGVMCP